MQVILTQERKNSITKIALLIMHQGQLERKKKSDQRLYSIRVCYNSQYALCYVRKSEKNVSLELEIKNST